MGRRGQESGAERGDQSSQGGSQRRGSECLGQRALLVLAPRRHLSFSTLHSSFLRLLSLRAACSSVNFLKAPFLPPPLPLLSQHEKEGESRREKGKRAGEVL